MPFESLQQDLDAARAGTMPLSSLARRLRDLQLPSSLPPKYGEVLTDLTDRIESSALFSGESCSFSESDLIEAVQAWLDKAQAKLFSM